MAVPNVVDAAKDADILIFVVPHQFIRNLAGEMLGKIKPTAVGLSLIKVCQSVITLHRHALPMFLCKTHSSTHK